MNLGDLWEWDKRKLSCKVRSESGNPAGDELRQRLAEVAGIDLTEFLNEMKASKTKKAKQFNAPGTAGQPDLASTDTGKSILWRSHIVGAAEISLQAIEQSSNTMTTSVKNIHKKHVSAPRSPPRRVIMDLQRERAKVLNVTVDADVAAAHKKLGKRLAKRANRFGANADLSQGANSLDSQSWNRRSPSEIFEKYAGDLFGTGGNYMGGMVYMSRIPKNTGKVARELALENSVIDNTGFRGADSPGQHAGGVFDGDEDEERMAYSDSDSEVQLHDELASKLFCVAQIAKWARHEPNAPRIASEGGVRVVVQLSMESNTRIRRLCSVAFRIMSENDTLARYLVHEGVVSAISELCTNSHQSYVNANCAVALTNLTRVDGLEGRLVEDGIVLALVTLINESVELSSLCARGLFNLTCVDSVYPFIERVIKSLVSLSSAVTADVKHICASALCNLADLKQVRVRMVEEGVISVMSLLARGSEEKTRRVCAVTLQNLATSRACRAEMVARGAVQACYGLSNDADPVILRCIAISLAQLSEESGNVNRVINEGGVSALCNIGLRYPTLAAISRPCAIALQLLSAQQSVQVTMVQEGATPAIVSLMRVPTDAATVRNALLALCNLLSASENQNVVIQHGCLPTIIQLCDHDDATIRHVCALCLYSLSTSRDSRPNVVNSGAISAILRLSAAGRSETQQLCGATLCNLSNHEKGIEKMVKEGVIALLVKLLSSRDSVVKMFCCAALCRLANTAGHCEKILEEGAIPHVVEGAAQGDTATQGYCAAVISALSFYESCRTRLVDAGALQALVDLSHSGEEVTSTRCLVAFANLSCDATVRGDLVQRGIVPILAQLSNTYTETNQLYCARALCNIASHEGSERAVVDQQGVEALMMIALVRTVLLETKQVCAKALANLLTPETMPDLLEKGLVQTISSLSRIENRKTMDVCCTLFCHVSATDIGRRKIIEKVASMTSLFNLMRADNRATKITCLKAVCNILFHAESRVTAIENGALGVLVSAATLGDRDTEDLCASALCVISSVEECRTTVVRDNPFAVLGHLLGAMSSNARRCAMLALCNFSWFEDTSAALVRANVPNVLVAMLNAKKLDSQLLGHASYVLRHVAFRDKSRLRQLVADGGMSALSNLIDGLLRLMDDDADEGGRCDAPGTEVIAADLALRNVSGVLRDICEMPSQRETCVSSGILHMFVSILSKSIDEECAYNCLAGLYSLSCERRLLPAMNDPAFCDTLERAMAHGDPEPCSELVAACLFLLATVPGNRDTVANSGVPRLLVDRIIPSTNNDAVLHNGIAALYMTSKALSTKGRLNDANVATLLTKYSANADERIRTCCSKGLSNLSTGSGDGIEEGTVAALIAMSIAEGPSANQSHVGEDPEDPVVIEATLEHYAPTASLDETQRLSPADVEIDRVKFRGGEAADSIPPPDAPVTAARDTAPYSNARKELAEFTSADTRTMPGATRMALAKMAVPASVDSAYRIREADLDVPDPNADNNPAAGEATRQPSSESLEPESAGGDLGGSDGSGMDRRSPETLDFGNTRSTSPGPDGAMAMPAATHKQKRVVSTGSDASNRTDGQQNGRKKKSKKKRKGGKKEARRNR